MEIECEFEENRAGRTICKVHQQALMYKYHELIICCDEEDRLISKYGWDEYHIKIRKQWDEVKEQWLKE